jgi:hypothetical protein
MKSMIFRLTVCAAFVSILTSSMIFDRQIFATLLNDQQARSMASIVNQSELFVLNFDNNLTGNAGQLPIQASGITYQTGVQNQAVYLAPGSMLSYSSVNNINSREGSIEFWIKPFWNGNDNQNRTIFSFGGGGGILVAKDGANNLRIILNRFSLHPGGEVGVAQNVGTWVSGQWHHVAFTWSDSSKKLRIFIDGTLRNETTFSNSLPAVNVSSFQIGVDGTSNYLNSLLDYLIISNAPRTTAEIAARMNSAISISSWNLTPNHSNIELTTGWRHSNLLSISATSNVGNITLPMIAAQWSSSNPAVAIVDGEGWIRGLTSGTATLTGVLGSTSRFINVTVTRPYCRLKTVR